MSNNEIFIGNVRFYKSDVASSSTSTTANGSKLYSVFLKNGTKIHFYDQAKDAGAYVMTGRDMGNDQKYGTAFSGIQGMVIEGSDKDDYYHLRDCDYYEVNVEDGGKDEVRVVNLNGEPQNTKVNTDKADNAYTVDITHGMSRSEGWFIGEMLPIEPPQPQTGAAPKRHEESEYWSSKYNTETGLTGEVPHMKIENPDGSRTLIFQWHTLDGIDYSKVGIKKNSDGTTRVTRYVNLALNAADLLKGERNNRIFDETVDINDAGEVVSRSIYGKWDKEGRPREELQSRYNDDGTITEARFKLSYSADGALRKTQVN